MNEADWDRLYLDHIETCIRNIESDVAGDSGVIERNRTVRDAVLRNLQVMDESTQRVSDAAKAAEPDIPWSRISGFRHRLVHDYFRIDTALIIRVVDEHLADLLAAVLRMKQTT